ncbi:MAG: hypothetical protein D084_Lepto4C00575G0001 [Leptospirillum sp. Group IV 'UBA BS']|nr:MAG: hypothetical protein D084_Lepto4C00575G0001 [Leptospirillum sp. Group IV 'UBA BS']
MDHEKVSLVGQGHHLLEKTVGDGQGRGIVRIAEKDRLDRPPGPVEGLQEILPDVPPGDHGVMANRGSRQDEAEGMDRIGGVGNQNPVARIDGGERQMGDSFLRADGDHRFGVGVENHIVAPGVPGGNRLPKPGNPLRGRVPVVAGVAHGLDKLVHDGRRSREIGIAHPEIDDVLPPAPGGELHVVDGTEDIGRKLTDSLEFHHFENSAFRHEMHRISLRDIRSGRIREPVPNPDYRKFPYVLQTRLPFRFPR